MGGGFEECGGGYRSLLDNGAIEQVKEITLFGVWIFEKKAVFREVIFLEMEMSKLFSISNICIFEETFEN